MDPITLINIAIAFLSQFGSVGHYIGIALQYGLGIPALITAGVALWHAAVALIAALAKLIPALSGLSDKLKASQDSLDSKSNVILAWLDRLSAIKLPASK